jgi:hypothetical protein
MCCRLPTSSIWDVADVMEFYGFRYVAAATAKQKKSLHTHVCFLLLRNKRHIKSSSPWSLVSLRHTLEIRDLNTTRARPCLPLLCSLELLGHVPMDFARDSGGFTKHPFLRCMRAK